MLEKLYKEYIWVKDKFEKNEIKFNINHNLAVVDYLKNGTIEERYEMFIELFLNSLTSAKLFGEITYLSSHEKCVDCGKIIYLFFDGETISDGKRVGLEIEKCDCVHLKDYSFNINVPSGQLIYTDRLPYLNELILDLNNISLDNKTNMKKRTLLCKKHNICHIFVGNTSPSIYNKNNKLVIGKSNEDEGLTPLKDSKEIGYICTDLWWVTLVDKELYKKMLLEILDEEEVNNIICKLNICSITKGVYKCNVNVNTTYEDEITPCTFFSLDLLT